MSYDKGTDTDKDTDKDTGENLVLQTPNVWYIFLFHIFLKNLRHNGFFIQLPHHPLVLIIITDCQLKCNTINQFHITLCMTSHQHINCPCLEMYFFQLQPQQWHEK